MPRTQFCCDHFTKIWMRAKLKFHHIWIAMEELLPPVKWVLGPRGGLTKLASWMISVFQCVHHMKADCAFVVVREVFSIVTTDKLIKEIDRVIKGFYCTSLTTHYDIALKWMTPNITNEKSTLDQFMAWCCHSVRQQAVIWNNVGPDLCRHMVSLGHNLLTFIINTMHLIAWQCKEPGHQQARYWPSEHRIFCCLWGHRHQCVKTSSHASHKILASCQVPLLGLYKSCRCLIEWKG